MMLDHTCRGKKVIPSIINQYIVADKCNYANYNDNGPCHKKVDAFGKLNFLTFEVYKLGFCHIIVTDIRLLWAYRPSIHPATGG
jgi:hypothetical protein